MLNFSYGLEEDSVSGDTVHWWTVGGVGAFNFTDWLTWATRFEYLNQRVPEDIPLEGHEPAPDMDLISLSTSLNFRLWERLQFRTEYRFDTSLTDVAPFNGNQQQHSLFLFLAYGDRLRVVGPSRR